MPRTLSETVLEASKGQPTVEIIFGSAHVGNYRCFLWDPDGRNPEQLAHGNNIDDVPDSFVIPVDPADLDGHILSQELIVQAADTRPGQVYSVTTTVRQGGKICVGGVIQKSGSLDDVKSLIDFRRFRTA